MEPIDLRTMQRRKEAEKKRLTTQEFIQHKLAAVSAFEKNAYWSRPVNTYAAPNSHYTSGASFYIRQFLITIAGLAMLFLVAEAGSLNPSASPAGTFHTLGEITSKSDSSDGYNRTLHSLQAISGDLLGTSTSTADFIFAPTATTTTAFWSVDTGGANVTISFDSSTSSPPYQGFGSVKAAAVSAVGDNNQATVQYNPPGVWNISQFTNIQFAFRTDSTSMPSYFVRLVDNQATVASSTYTFKPTVANQWEKIVLPVASTSLTTGTLDKTKIDKIVFGITESVPAAAVNFWVEAPGVNGGAGLATIETIRRDTMAIGTYNDATTTPAAASSLFSALKFISGNTTATSTVFTATGTWTRLSSQISQVWVTMCGGGGAGNSGGTPTAAGEGGGGGGGGGAGQLYVRYPVIVSGNVTVTVGAAGSNSSFGSLTATAGSAGVAGSNGGSRGAFGGSGDPAGTNGASSGDSAGFYGGTGGAGGASSFFGIAGGGGVGGAGGANNGSNGSNASGYCAGGGGGGGGGNVTSGSPGGTGGSGGTGAAGLVIVEWYQ